MTSKNRDDWKAYLRQCTDAQVRGCYEKERAANRRAFAQLCMDEAARRGIVLR